MTEAPDVMRQFHGAIEGLLSPEQQIIYRANLQAAEQKEIELVNTVRTSLAVALEDISYAIRYPRICVGNLESAVLLLTDALSAARQLDQ